jgi:hypothetical protein
VNVFVLYFLGPDRDGNCFERFLGVYSSQASAGRAGERHQGLPGYRHYSKGFQVECIQLDEDQDEQG